MLHNGIDYDIIWYSDDEYKLINNKPRCERFKKETLLVNRETFEYYYCGSLRNRPTANIDSNFKNELLINGITEHAQMTYKNEKFVQFIGRVYVVGGGYNGKQREHGLPHFKLIKNDGDELRIIIPQKPIKDIIIHDIIILDDKQLDRKSKEILLEWLTSISIHAKNYSNMERSNVENLASQWNILNADDNNVQLINMDVYN